MLALDDIVRFWSKVNRLGSNDCWNWIGGCTGNEESRRRPTFKLGQINYIATRVAWKIQYGEDPSDFLVCHTCTQKQGTRQLCVNPNHLWLGTPSENSQDAADKGLLSTNNRSKLMEHDRQRIRERFSNGEGPTQIGLDYNLSRQSIHRIVTQQTFKEVS